jgi:hypothetical protein
MPSSISTGVYSGLVPASLMIGNHRFSSAFCNVANASDNPHCKM